MIDLAGFLNARLFTFLRSTLQDWCVVYCPTERRVRTFRDGADIPLDGIILGTSLDAQSVYRRTRDDITGAALMRARIAAVLPELFTDSAADQRRTLSKSERVVAQELAVVRRYLNHDHTKAPVARADGRDPLHPPY